MSNLVKKRTGCHGRENLIVDWVVQGSLAEEGHYILCVLGAEVSLYVCGTAWYVEVMVGKQVQVVSLIGFLIWKTGQRSG